MNDRLALLRAIRAATDDDTLRFVFADWLDEHDDPLDGEVGSGVCAGHLPNGDPALMVPGPLTWLLVTFTERGLLKDIRVRESPAAARGDHPDPPHRENRLDVIFAFQA